MRKNDNITNCLHSRSQRFFEQDGHWFFNSREGIRFGAFASRFDAELAACLMFTRVSQAESESEARSVMAHFQLAPPVSLAGSNTQALAVTSAATDRPPSERNGWALPMLRRFLDPAFA